MGVCGHDRTPPFSGILQFRDPARFTKIGRDMRGEVLVIRKCGATMNVSTHSRFFLYSQDFEPAYLRLYRTGELHKRARQAIESLASCYVCPRDCGVDRLANKTAACKTGRYAR